MASRATQLLILCCAALLLLGAKPWVHELAPGYGGPQDDRGGAGNEQPSVAVVQDHGELFLVTVYMSSADYSSDAPWQCRCSSMRLDPVDGPVATVTAKVLTDNIGDRPCNHPKIASDGNHIVWTWGDNNPNRARVRTYVAALDYKCDMMSDVLRISENDNNNDGAPDITFNAGSTWTAGYLSTGNNDTSYAVGVSLDKSTSPFTISKTWHMGVVAPSNIGRPTIVPLNGDRSFFCAAKGDNRPPEDGVECATLNANTGEVLHKELVAASDRDNDIYMNQPQLARVGDKVALSIIESSGEGRRSNDKGTSMTHLHVLEPSDSAVGMRSTIDSVGPYQAHATICAGAYGENGSPHVALFDASVTGSGLATVTFSEADLTSAVLNPMVERVAGAHNGDSGWIANLYGQNPNNQGRDFLRCIGDVPNPGYGLENGFMPNVKTFFALPYAGMKPGEPKNALFLSLMPGEVDPEPSEPDPTDPDNPDPEPGPDTPKADGRYSASTCAVASAPTSGGATIALLALALLGAVIRRRHS